MFDSPVIAYVTDPISLWRGAQGSGVKIPPSLARQLEDDAVTYETAVRGAGINPELFARLADGLGPFEYRIETHNGRQRLTRHGRAAFWLLDAASLRQLGVPVEQRSTRATGARIRGDTLRLLYESIGCSSDGASAVPYVEGEHRHVRWLVNPRGG